VRDGLERHPDLARVVLCFFSEEDRELCERVCGELLGSAGRSG